MSLLTLPAHLLSSIVETLQDPVDLLSFALICRATRDATRHLRDITYACKVCGARIKDKRGVIRATACPPWAACVIGMEGPMVALPGSPPPALRRGVRCAYDKLDAFIIHFFQGAAKKFGIDVSQCAFHPLSCSACDLYLGFAVSGAGDKDEDELCFITKRYLDEIDATNALRRGGRDEVLCCLKQTKVDGVWTPCGNAIGYARDVVSCDHTWDGGNGSESAYLMAKLVPPNSGGGVKCSNRRTEQLAQGAMVVEDVACARCSRPVGWAFTRNKEGDGSAAYSCVTASYVGRFGLVSSAVCEPIASGDGYICYPEFGIKSAPELVLNAAVEIANIESSRRE